MRFVRQAVAQRLGDAAFADAGLARKDDQLAFAGAGLLPARHHHRHLGVAADQRGEVLVVCLETALGDGDGGCPPRRNGVDDTF